MRWRNPHLYALFLAVASFAISPPPHVKHKAMASEADDAALILLDDDDDQREALVAKIEGEDDDDLSEDGERGRF